MGYIQEAKISCQWNIYKKQKLVVNGVEKAKLGRPGEKFSI